MKVIDVINHYKSLCTQRWDVVIFGAGYAGWGALQASLSSGKRTLVVAHRPGLLPESGWSFHPENGTSTEPLWRTWLEDLESSGAANPDFTDGALAEIAAARFCKLNHVPILLYSQPVAVEMEDSLLASVILAGKSGLSRVVSKQWIDTTEGASLTKLLSPQWNPAKPSSQIQNLTLRHSGESFSKLEKWDLPALGSMCLLPGIWPNEVRLRIESESNAAFPRNFWVPALQALQGSALLNNPVLTHGSLVPFCRYADPVQTPPLPDNVAICVPGNSGHCFDTLGDRFESGVLALRSLEGMAKSEKIAADSPASVPSELPELESEVMVAGLGTGGGLAAIAAARNGARVLALDALPFPGGISTGGGIHSYYFGIKGGLQQELDDGVRKLMPLFGRSSQVKGFHPDAKKIVLESMLQEAGVSVHYECTLFSVVRDQRKISNILASSASGPLRIRGSLYIDATGDGDLCAGAGEAFRQGRSGDGLLHAYSQSCGRVSVKNDIPTMEVVNFDAGFCDPTDDEDLTRSRIEGVAQHAQKIYTETERPTYIAPAIGLRQSRHIETDYVLTLQDLITRQSFPDAIGYTGAHYDNHAHDYEFESEEAAFWIWGCHQWYTGTLACELPYRILLPKGLDNVLIACRALGVSEEAHHSVRMQRDIQRIGEVAGVAASTCLKAGLHYRKVPMEKLKAALVESGALKKESLPYFPMDGRVANIEELQLPSGTLDQWMNDIQQSPASPSLWRIYRAGIADPTLQTPVLDLLVSTDSLLSWRAAMLLAMWGNPAAEPRLLKALAQREKVEEEREFTRSHHSARTAPRWQAALVFLRRCASTQCLPVLTELSADSTLTLNQRTGIAMLCAHLCKHTPIETMFQKEIPTILENLLATIPPHAVREPGGGILFNKIKTPTPTDKRAQIEEDYSWQLDLVICQVKLALNLPVASAFHRHLHDPRLIVRRRFENLLHPVA